MGDNGVPDQLCRLIDDLKALRRGYGVESRDVAARVGPELRLICGITACDAQPVQRVKIIALLNAVVADLPDHLADMARTTFGLENSADQRFEERMTRMAVAMDRDVRTVRRHVDHLLARIAETMLAHAMARPGGHYEPSWRWHTADLTTVVVLDAAAVEVIEQRRVVSRSEHLITLDCSMTITDDQPIEVTALGLAVISGATLCAPERVGSSRLAFELVLPRPLAVGEEHTIMVRMKLPTTFAPFYVCTPTRPCDRFNLAVRFADEVPIRAWRVEDELPIDLWDRLITRCAVPVDGAGEARASFTGLTLNRSYGIGWEMPG